MPVTSIIVKDQNALEALRASLMNTKRPDMIALAEEIGDGTLTADEFVSATQTVLPKYLAAHPILPQNPADYFAKAMGDHKDAEGDTATAIIIDPDEVVDLWQSLDKLNNPQWDILVPLGNASVGGRVVGSLSAQQRIVPKGWHLSNKKLDSDNDWEVVELVQTDLVINKDALSITADELSGLIYPPSDYARTIRKVEASRVVGDQIANLFFNKMNGFPGLNVFDVVKMSPPRTNGNVIHMNWSSITTGANGLNLNSLITPEYMAADYPIDTWGTWRMEDTGLQLKVTLITMSDVDIPGISTSPTSEGTKKLVQDLLNFANAFLVQKQAMPGSTTDQIKAALLKRYDKETGTVVP